MKSESFAPFHRISDPPTRRAPLLFVLNRLFKSTCSFDFLLLTFVRRHISSDPVLHSTPPLVDKIGPAVAVANVFQLPF
jgi:hypothetical protein